MNGIKVVSLILPKFKLGQWPGIVSEFKHLLGFLFKDIFDLFRPGNDRAFEYVGLIFIRSDIYLIITLSLPEFVNL